MNNELAQDINPNAVYSKSQTAQILGVSRHTLRKYTKLGGIRTIIHYISGRECYLGSEILRAWQKGLNVPVSTTTKVPKLSNGANELLSLNSTELRSRLNEFMARRKRI